jgi:hypothetical protein
MNEDEHNADPAPDFGPEDQWVNPDITNAINTLQEVLYSAGCSVNGLTILIPNIPGEDAVVHSDYGDIYLQGNTEV